MSKQTVWYALCVLRNPNAEPFAVVSCDTNDAPGDGTCPATVVSLHWDRAEADRIVGQFNKEPCEYCGPGMMSGLPDNACENCMNTRLKYPTAADLS